MTIIPLLSGVIASVSRMVYGGFIFLGFIQLVRRKKRLALLMLIISVLALTQLNIIHGFKVSSMLDSYIPQSAKGVEPNDIRGLTRYKAVEIWKDHPLWGVGPGMFGGVIAFKYHSYMHSEYNLHTQGHLESVGSIEQFWFQLLAETGIVGVLLFINVIGVLFMTLYTLRQQAVAQDLKNVFSALMVFLPCILIYSIGSGINIAPVLFTYCAFVGIGLGSRVKG